MGDTGRNATDTNITVTKESIVFCRKLRPQAYIPLDECQGCEYYHDMRERSTAQNGRPAVHDILCGLPQWVPVTPLLREVV